MNHNMARHGATPSPLYGRIARAIRQFRDTWNRIGGQTQFYVTTLRSLGDALVRYRGELARLIAQMSFGTGALVLIGGTVVIVSFLTTFTGSLVAVQGYHTLSGVGVEALTGFISAFANPRLGAPFISSVGLTATIGAGATAQLGAMRINEEIDALEVIGVRSVAYLASTRVIAGVIVIIPLFCLATLTLFMGAKVTTGMYGQSSGVYDHYFNTFLNPDDLLWSFAIVVCSGTAVMLIHTYYGYNASGGPAGVGEAVGRAVRTSLVVEMFVILFISLAIYGQTGNFHLSD
jgi:phospholipid/cholesterol/gamma-HCH transport system permease protein